MVNTFFPFKKTQEYDNDDNDLQNFLFSDGIVGEKQKEYITAFFEVKKINGVLHDLQSKKSNLLLFKQTQLEINTEATHTVNNKNIKKPRHLFNGSNDNLTETELKIRKIDIQITNLENALFLAKKELEAISLSLKLEQDKQKEPFIDPIWKKKVDTIKERLASLEQQQLTNEENLEQASKNCSLSTTELEKLQQESTQIKATFSSVGEEFHQTQQKHFLYRNDAIETLLYWISIATGGLFKSARYKSERSLIKLRQRVNELIISNNQKNTAIDELNQKISREKSIVDQETEQLNKINLSIKKEKETITALESSGLKKINKIRKKCNNLLFILNKTPVSYSVKRFIQHPTTSNLNKLLEKMKKDSNYLKNKNVKKLILLVANVYEAVGSMYQEIENGLLSAESDEQNVFQELIANIETDLLLLQDQYQQVCSKDLSEEYFKLACEKTDMSESIFLKDALTRKNELTQIKYDLEKIEQQYDERIANIENPDSAKGREQIELIDADFTKQTEQYNLLQEKLVQINKEMNCYTKKQQEQIKRCYISIADLELDIRGNRSSINAIENKIQQIKMGETAELKVLQKQINAKKNEIDTIKEKKQTTIATEQLAIEQIKVKTFLDIPELRPVAEACGRFKKAPTNDNLNALITTIKANIHSQSNPLLLEEIGEIGVIYGAVSDAVLFAQQQAPTIEQMTQIIISECRQYIVQHSSTLDKLLKPARTLLETITSKHTPKTPTSISDFSVMEALKAVLKNNPKKPNSIEIIKEFLKYSVINETTEIYRLVKKASEIHPQIRAAYVAATQEGKSDTTTFKERFDEQKKTDFTQSSIDHSSTDDGLASDLLKIK